MTPDEVAAVVAETITLASARITGDGARQYWTPGQPQRFETMPLVDLARYVDEEILDLINYAVFQRIRMHRIAAAIAEMAGRE